MNNAVLSLQKLLSLLRRAEYCCLSLFFVSRLQTNLFKFDKDRDELLAIPITLDYSKPYGIKRLVHKPKLGLGLSMYKQILRLDFSIKQGYISDVFI